MESRSGSSGRCLPAVSAAQTSCTQQLPRPGQQSQREEGCSTRAPRPPGRASTGPACEDAHEETGTGSAPSAIGEVFLGPWPRFYLFFLDLSCQ